MAVLPAAPLSPTVVTVAEFVGVPAADAATVTSMLNALAPPLAAIAVELVQVTVGAVPLQDHTPEFVLLLNAIPPGNVSVTVVVPVVAAAPAFVTVIVYVPVCPTVKLPT